MDPSGISPLVAGALAVSGAIAAVVVSKVWDWLRDRRRDGREITVARITDGASVRQELWAELAHLRSRIDSLQDALDRSRTEYLTLLQDNATLKIEHAKLKHEHEELQSQYDEIRADLERAARLDRADH